MLTGAEIFCPLHDGWAVFWAPGTPALSLIMSKFLGKSPIPFGKIEENIIDDHVRTCSVGIDCHRDSYHVYFLHLSPLTAQIQERYCKFAVGNVDIDSMVVFLSDCESAFQTKIELLILESTGPYSRQVFERLASRWASCMINPAEFSKYGKKSDKFDARKMALLALQGLFSPSFLSTGQEEQLKMTSRACSKAKNGMTRESNSLSSFLIHCGVGITRGAARVSILSVSGRQILEGIIGGVTDPEACANLALYYNPEHIKDSQARSQARREKHAA